MTLKYLILGMGLAGLVGCQSLPESRPAPQPDQEKTTERKTIRTPTGVVIHPYEQEEIQRKKLQVVVPEQKVQQRFEDGRSLPAFKKLMQQTQTAYRQGQWARAGGEPEKTAEKCRSPGPPWSELCTNTGDETPIMADYSKSRPATKQ